MENLRHILLLLNFTLLCICWKWREKDRERGRERERDNIPPTGCVWLYKDCYYKGRKLEICGDIVDFVKLEFNDVASSIKVGSGVIALIFSDINLKGHSIWAIKDNECFVNYDFNDVASSIQLYDAAYANNI